MKNNTKELFEEYKLIHNFMYNELLKKWINEDNFENSFIGDWNSLMSVVEKIEDVSENNECTYNVQIEQCFCTIINNHTSENIVEIDADSKYSAIYQAVIEFIKYYNNEKN